MTLTVRSNHDKHSEQWIPVVLLMLDIQFPKVVPWGQSKPLPWCRLRNEYITTDEQKRNVWHTFQRLYQPIYFLPNVVLPEILQRMQMDSLQLLPLSKRYSVESLINI